MCTRGSGEQGVALVRRKSKRTMRRSRSSRANENSMRIVTKREKERHGERVAPSFPASRDDEPASFVL